MWAPLLLQFILFFRLLVYAQSSSHLGYIPLAVKTPYLHAWISYSEGPGLGGVWPKFVSRNHVFEWAGMIRVDGQAYQWMGDSGFNFPRAVASEITPTKSIFRFEAGPIQFNATFFSPVEPTDYVRQSMPFSYMYIDGIAAVDTLPHTVQVYSDISAQWASKDEAEVVEWNMMTKDNLIYQRIARQKLSPMGQDDGVAEDAIVYYTTPQRPGLTWQNGRDVPCRNAFAANGSLSNSGDTRFRTVNDSLPVLSFSVDLGSISPGDHPDPVVWSLGLVRDPLVIYTTDQVTQNRTAYYWSKYASIEDVMSASLGDFSDALNRSLALDEKILSTASTPEHAGILSLVTRQIFASMDITLPSARPGQFNISDVKIFMKDIGVSLRTNPVEVIYGALPALTYFNPFLVRDLLQPLLEFQSSPRYSNSYASPDLGASYPLVHNDSIDTHTQAVESCGDMLIMAYALTVKSGDTALISQYYPLLQRWTDFLIENTLHPRGFISADGIGNSDMSNLAIKGILGIYSMAKITETLGISNATYMDSATQFTQAWKSLALAADGHIQAIYGSIDSWGLMYNLFPAIWLKTGLIDEAILEHQAQFYAQQTFPQFGLNLDSSRPDAAYPHWTLMTAATIPDSFTNIRNKLISATYQQGYNQDVNNLPLPIMYKPSNGDANSGVGSPILGAAFALAAVNSQNVGSPKSPQATSPPGPPGHHKRKAIDAIIGGVVGGCTFLLLVVTIIFITWRRRKQRHSTTDATTKPEITPFTQLRDNNVASGTVPSLNRTRSRLSKWIPRVNRPLTSPPVEVANSTTQHGMTRKQREALGLSNEDTPTRIESAAPPNPSPDQANLNSTPRQANLEGEGLREEFERLRMEIESIRRIAAPPEYAV